MGHVERNRLAWNEYSEEYQRTNAPQIRDQAFTGELAWGTWNIPESQLQVLGDVGGKEILEFGCGGAQWSMALTHHGARPIGVDLSDRQLTHARALMEESGARLPLVQASGERLPFKGESFDIVFADYGAFTFADPYRTVPEATRVLRPGGLLAFSILAPIYEIATPMDADHATDRLVYDYFGMHAFEDPDGMVEFNLPYGEWIRLFRENDLTILDLIETRPDEDAVSTYRDAEDLAWSRRWPSECIWRLRKEKRREKDLA